MRYERRLLTIALLGTGLIVALIVTSVMAKGPPQKERFQFLSKDPAPRALIQVERAYRGGYGVGESEPKALSIYGAADKPLVVIDLQTGHAKLSGDPNEAARSFWKAVEIAFKVKPQKQELNEQTCNEVNQRFFECSKHFKTEVKSPGFTAPHDAPGNGWDPETLTYDGCNWCDKWHCTLLACDVHLEDLDAQP